MADQKAAPAEPYNYRLATDPDGNHGYEVGFWPAGADLNDPAAYRVEGKCYTQAEAALMAHNFNLAPPPDHLPPEEGNLAEEPEEEAPPARPRHRK